MIGGCVQEEYAEFKKYSFQIISCVYSVYALNKVHTENRFYRSSTVTNEGENRSAEYVILLR